MAANPEETHKPYNRKYDRKKVKILAEQGIIESDIARIVDVHPSTINRYLKSIELDKQAINAYSSLKADALCLNQIKAANVADYILDLWNKEPEKYIKSQDPRLQKEILTAANSVKTYDHSAERLERGESTANVQTIHADLATLQEQK